MLQNATKAYGLPSSVVSTPRVEQISAICSVGEHTPRQNHQHSLCFVVRGGPRMLHDATWAMTDPAVR